MNDKMNAVLDKTTDEVINFDDLEKKLEAELEYKMSELQFLDSEKEQIGNPDALGATIKNVVWEQFLNQIAVTAGKDFIEDNRGLTLDLRADAHTQTTENFAEGKIATHNTKIDYQKRYDDWQSNFKKDKDGNIVTHYTRSGKQEATLTENARNPFDEDRPSGSKEKHTDIDHTIPAAEIIRDPAANAHMTLEEQVDFANSAENLYEMDSSLNRSKGDKSTTDWLDNPNSKGQKPNEIFDISEEDDKAMRQKDKESREEYEKRLKEAEKRSTEAGKQSRKEEAFRIGKKALRAVAMQLLAELTKEIISKLVKWFKEKKRSFDTLISSIKDAIKSFISRLKEHIINAGDTLMTTIATAIYGPIVALFKKAWMILKQGWKSLMETVAFLKDPAHKNMPISFKILEIGKIVIAGLSATGALTLGELITKGLAGAFPPLAVEIPLIGSLADIIGIFMGAVIAGIIGAIVINFLDSLMAKKRLELLTENQIDKSNEILDKQMELINMAIVRTNAKKRYSAESIKQRHIQAGEIIKEAVSEIFDRKTKDNKVDFDEIDSTLDDLLDSK